MKKGILLICCIIPIILVAQVGYSDWETLYQDAGLKVEIQFKISATSCQNNGKQSKFRYRVAGNNPYSSYLNWKMDYIDCNGNLHFRQYSVDVGRSAKKGILESLDYLFICQSLEQPYYNAALSGTSATGSGLIATAYSRDPQNISGDGEVYRDQTTTLKVVGGKLGAGAKWVWYSETCGENQLGTGRELNVQPSGTITYYVRGEGYNNNTNCVSFTVEVNQNSLAPDGINGKNKLCAGEEATLVVDGGSLGQGGQWVWYEQACGGRSIGTGPTLEVSPGKATQYFVRAEGDLNTTVCASIFVSSAPRSSVPTAAIASDHEICEGEQVHLSVSGNASGQSNWEWYERSCGGKLAGTGPEIIVKPLHTTTYYVRGTGGCDQSICRSVTVKVNELSVVPTSVSYDKTVNKKDPVTLTVVGGKLGSDAQWHWYENSCGGNLVGTGKTYTAQFSMNKTLYVRAEGKCNTTKCFKETVTPVKEHKFHPFDTYDGYNNKFMHVGIGLGMDAMSFSLPDELGDINGFGFKGEVVYHPYYKDFFSVGLVASYAMGTTPMWIVGGNLEINNGLKEEEYSYNRFEIGTEVTVRSPIGKLNALLQYKNSFQNHSFSQRFSSHTVDDTEVEFDVGLRKQTLGFGLRFGPFKVSQKGRGMSMDAMYTWSRDYDWSWSKSNERNGAISDWQSGAAFGVWVHSILKFQYNLSWDTQLGHFIPQDTPSDFTQYHQLSIIYNRNAFR